MLPLLYYAAEIPSARKRGGGGEIESGTCITDTPDTHTNLQYWCGSGWWPIDGIPGEWGERALRDAM